MNLLSLLFAYIIYPAYALWLRLTRPSDFSVERASLEYTIDGRPSTDVKDEPWLGEKKFWEWYTTPCLSFLTQFTHPDDYRFAKVPDCVVRTIARVKYNFKGKTYKYLTTRTAHEWPPHTPDGVAFHVPLAEVTLCDANGKPQRDITEKIKRYAGPRGDFHGEVVNIRDLLLYREETLKSDFPYVKLQNSLGLKKTISTLSGTTSDLKIP